MTAKLIDPKGNSNSMMIMTVVAVVGSDGYFFSSAWGFEESFCKAETLDLELEQYTGV